MELLCLNCRCTPTRVSDGFKLNLKDLNPNPTVKNKPKCSAANLKMKADGDRPSP